MDHDLIGTAPAFQEVVERATALAAVDRPVLVIGERGTGKELIARRLHYLSPRWAGPLVTVNCAALAEGLLDSELFGHEAGAFTGAVRRRSGRFEAAEGGTLFLDEIAAASSAVQEKLLRAIEYGTYDRLGGETELSADVRIVAATNEDLPVLARTGRFRADLLDRLAFDVLTLPPLRERREDILQLAEHFAVQMTRALGRPFFPGFSEEAEARLLAHDWPGNVRELRNAVERAVAHSPDGERRIASIRLDPFASPWRPRAPAAPLRADEEEEEKGPVSPLSRPSQPFDLQARLLELERDSVLAALEACQYHQKRAAAWLGLEYHQLRHLLKKHDLLERRTPEPADV